jgi:3-oxoacyl-[acyl-carrier protein] reductase
MMGTCEGKVALVTGAAGMGRSIALTLAREGARVVVNYRTSGDSATAIVEHIASRGGRAAAVRADVFEAEACRRLVDAAVDAFGRVDICVINPGAGWHPEPIPAIDAEAALEDARRELAPIYYLMPLVLPGMCERKWGRLVALGLGRPYDSPSYAYNVAKAAREHAILLSQAAAWKHDVTVNVIGPPPVSEIETLEQAIELCAHGPAWVNRTTATPQDIAEGVAFLCSEAGQFISGCELAYQWRS